MAVTYYALLTTIGAGKLANATALGTTLKLTQLALGDGGGNVPTPDASRTALVNEVRRAPLNQLSIDPTNSSQIIAEQVIPEDVGGWWIREMGLYDESGALIAYANCAPSYKPQLAEGSGRTQTVRMVLIVSNTASVELKIDPSVVLATREYVDNSIVTALNRLDYKQSVRVATTASITLSGLQTVDGVVLAAGDRVLVKSQAIGSQNGIYVVAAGAWARSADADENAEVTPALTVLVESGTAQADSVWQLITDAPIVIGTTALVFQDFTNGLARLASPAFTGSPTAPTPAQFDNDSSLATTQFVQRALGNMAGYTTIDVSTVLTAADAGKYILANTNITLSLPDATALPPGTRYYIQASSNVTGNGVIVNNTNGNFSGPNANWPGANFVKFTAGMACEFISTGNGWAAVGGSGGASLSSSGYQRLPSGLIIQWGVAMGSVGALSAAYPVAFPNAVLQVAATLADKTIGNNAGISLYLTAANFGSKTTLTITVNGSDGTGSTAARYIAIGY